jgi:hypothetical protein
LIFPKTIAMKTFFTLAWRPAACMFFVILPVAVFAQKIKATGTGQTTGHIATLTVSNPGKEAITLNIGPFLIPSSGKFQGYGVPGVYDVVVPPKGSVDIPLSGYCTNPFVPPVSPGADMPRYDTWVTPGETPFITPGATLRPEDGFIFTPVSDSLPAVTYPGTDIPFPYTINIDAHPDKAAELVIDILHALETAYNDLEQAGGISTPFSGDPPAQQSAVIQQTFWIIIGILTGRAYEFTDFRDNLVQQFETNTNTPLTNAPPRQQEELESGIEAFWSTFQLVGVEAKVLRQPTEEEQDKRGSCRLVCPPENGLLDGEDVRFEWECSGDMGDAVDLRISSDKAPPIEVNGLRGTSYSPPQALAEGGNYKAELRYHSGSQPAQAAPVSFSTNPDCYRELLDMIRRLDSLGNLVKDARDALESNPLVQEARTIDMVAQLLTNPQSALDLFDQWLNGEFSFPDLDDVENADDLVDYLNNNLNDIQKALEYAKKLLEFTRAQTGSDTQGLIAKINAALSALERQDSFEDAYNNLRSAVNDLRGFLGDQIQNYTQDRIRSMVERMLIRKLGARAAGAVMSAAMDSWNFIGALIAQGRLDEAKSLHTLMYFDMLKKAHECPRYRIDETWNSTTNGLPQIEWGNCEDVENKNVTLEAVVNCWTPKPGGAPHEGSFEERRINFAGGQAQVIRRQFRSDCSDNCALQFQLDLADLAAKAAGCERAFVEIKVKVAGSPDQSVFAGVYRP